MSLILSKRAGGEEQVAMSNISGDSWSGTLTCFRTGNLNVRFDLTVGGSTQSVSVPIGGLVLIDPQGVVYDKARFDAAKAQGKTDEQARAAGAITGATVQLQRQSSGVFGEVPAGDPGIAPQINPELTGSDGIFQWDVVAGIYRAIVTKAGYVGATSRVVVIPPAVTDLHIPLRAVNAAPQTTVTKSPKKTVKTKRRKARVRFEFRSSDDGSTFACKLDGGAFRSCTSPRSYKVGKGSHTFQVRAIDSAGLPDPTPASFRFKVKRTR